MGHDETKFICTIDPAASCAGWEDTAKNAEKSIDSVGCFDASHLRTPGTKVEDTNGCLPAPKAKADMDDVVNLLDEFVWDLHKQMAPPTELQFVQDLKAFARTLPDGICTRATACSGSEVKVHVENCLSRCWKKRYGIDIRFKHVLAGEF